MSITLIEKGGSRLASIEAREVINRTVEFYLVFTPEAVQDRFMRRDWSVVPSWS